MIEENSVLSDLDCSVCLLTPRSPPIYQCGNGHLVCLECRPRTMNCPVCTSHYIEGRILLRNIFAEKMLEKVGTMIDEASVLSDLECPVCLLTPRSSPIYQCVNGHLVCSECRPHIVNCPLCMTNYIDILGNIFAEKMLEKVERGCRYELNDCKFKSRSSDALIEHETECGFKPPDVVEEEDRNGLELKALLVENFVLLVFLFLKIVKIHYGLAVPYFVWYFRSPVLLLTVLLNHIYLYRRRVSNILGGCEVLFFFFLLVAEIKMEIMI